MDKWEQAEMTYIAEYCGLNLDHMHVRDREAFFAGSNSCLRPALIAALSQCEADTIRRCAAVCDEKAQEFLSPEYAGGLPLSSVSERFACGQVKDAILSLLPEEYRK